MRKSWTEHFHELALLAASRSKDPSEQTGAVIVDDMISSRTVLGMGYNGFPRGVLDLPERYSDKAIKHQFVVHAEANAILNARQSDLCNATIFCTKFPCWDCAKLIIQSGMKYVYSPEPHENKKVVSVCVRQMFVEASVIHFEGEFK